MLVFIIGFLFISIVGSLMHFLYDKTNHNKLVGVFVAVNESVWEHIKIALTPAFIYSLIDGYIYGENPNYFFAKLVGLASIIIIIPLIFYTYTKFTKKNIIAVDISTFFIAIFLSQFFTYRILLLQPVPYTLEYISLVVIFIIFGFYLLLTTYPIKNKLFKNPITKKYGIEGHGH